MKLSMALSTMIVHMMNYYNILPQISIRRFVIYIFFIISTTSLTLGSRSQTTCRIDKKEVNYKSADGILTLCMYSHIIDQHMI